MLWIYKVQEAISYIENNLCENISIESVARSINYASSSIQNYFSIATGYTIGEYIRFRRLSCAVDDLSEGKLSITEIAFNYGYNTVEAFSKAFKRQYGCTPSKFDKSNPDYHCFSPISIEFKVRGGYNMTKNYISGLSRVDWSDSERINEFVQCVVSAMGALGEKLEYDYVSAISGTCFRTTFALNGLSSGLPGIGNVIWTVEHAFKMLGYHVTVHRRADYETDIKMIKDSIDRGIPVITIGGVLHYAEACLISGYDKDGEVLLGYSAYMDASDKDLEENDETGYFRKSNWHNEVFAKRNGGFIVIIGEKSEKPSKEIIYKETVKIATKLINTKVVNNRGEGYDQLNGLAAHTAFSEELLLYNGANNEEVMLEILCMMMMMYNEIKLAASYFRENGKEELASIFDNIGVLRNNLKQIIPEDFEYTEKLSDKAVLEEYANIILRIRDLEELFINTIK